MIDYSSFKHETYPETLILVVTGKLDGTTSEFLLDCIQGHIESGEHRFVLDCSELSYISSFGLGTLVRANSRLKKQGGVIALSGVKGFVADALRVVHFDRLFHIFDDVDQAAEALQDELTDDSSAG